MNNIEKLVILLKKLDITSVSGTMLKIIMFYLEELQQYTHINGSSNNILPTDCGIPQGFILESLLYSSVLIYVEFDPNILMNTVNAD